MFRNNQYDSAVWVLQTVFGSKSSISTSGESSFVACVSGITERSFSCLRRLKTWLRSTMSETRLNDVADCNVHQDRLDSIDINQLVKDFGARSDIRIGLFGNWATKIIILSLGWDSSGCKR